jgi:Mg2+ and Co2+ transporter CorA
VLKILSYKVDHLLPRILHSHRDSIYTPNQTTETIQIFNIVSIQEDNNGIRQGQSIKFITVLATLFVPLSLVSSVFGTDVQELGVNGGQHIWTFSAVAFVGTTLISSVAWFTQTILAYFQPQTG